MKETDMKNLDAVKQIERGMNLNGNITKRRGKFVVNQENRIIDLGKKNILSNKIQKADVKYIDIHYQLNYEKKNSAHQLLLGTCSVRFSGSSYQIEDTKSCDF